LVIVPTQEIVTPAVDLQDCPAGRRDFSRRANMSTTGLLEQRDAVAGFFAQQSEHCQLAPRYFSPRQYNHADECGIPEGAL
jgi:hypothetical protein